MRMALGVVVLLCGCGQSITGTWRGGLTFVTACSDDTGRLDVVDSTWNVVDHGDRLNIDRNTESCALAVARCSSADCQLETGRCATFVGGTTSFSGGFVRVTGVDIINVEIRLTGDFDTRETCQSVGEGVMKLQ